MKFSPDGTRGYVVTSHQRGLVGAHADALDVYVLAVDTVTGQAVGTPLDFREATTVSGAAGTVHFSADGTRAYQVISQKVGADVKATPHMVVVDLTDGALLNTVRLTGSRVGEMQVSADGSRVYQTTSTTLTTFDGRTGALISAQTLAGTPASAMVFSGKAGDPGYVAVSTTVNGRTHTVVQVIDTATGSILETWAPQAGQVSTLAAPVLNTQTGRLYVMTEVHGADEATTSTVIRAYSLDHGAPIRNPITLAGQLQGPLMVSADGTRLLQTFNELSPASGELTTALAVIDSHVPVG